MGFSQETETGKLQFGALPPRQTQSNISCDAETLSPGASSPAPHFILDMQTSVSGERKCNLHSMESNYSSVHADQGRVSCRSFGG